ncbi:DUF561 domain-containing protein [Bacillus lacus]|uniref:Probable nitronate monooxygenase n=1 Tax=Metabacillus lacus TaxID=1983721 RepID=A0A7X2IYB1_9BACI|nr:DUF561 domain-containing protein [Metabacillus lacus]
MNKLLSVLQIKYPILQGGMGNISNAVLTAAVSEAGGLGTIGAGTMTPAQVESIIEQTKQKTDKPFSLNVALGVSPYSVELLKLAVKHELAAVTLSAGNPAPFLPMLKEAGFQVLTVVASVKQAKKAQEAGADIIIAEGYEAAGINSSLETTTLTLIPQIMEAVSLPVVAAGGIGDGRGLAGMLALGASGVQMGTRFVATQEAPFHDYYKERVLAATDHDTVIVGRSVGKIRRLMTTPYSMQLLQAEKNGISADKFNELTTEDHHCKGALEGNEQDGFLNGGQVSGLITDIPSVHELLERMMKEAREQLRRASEDLL